MDSKEFEALSRRVGTAATRRGALKVLAGGIAASALAVLRPGRGAAEDDVNLSRLPESVPIVNCKVTLQSCHDDRQCCSGICSKKVKLDPPPDPLIVPLPDPLPPAEIPLPDELEGVCDCKPSGATCYKLLEGSFCCSGRCTNEAKCA
jgi:hypothetical protein